MINDKYYKRRYVIAFATCLIILGFLIRLFYLQVIDNSSKNKADDIAFYNRTIYPPRGIIYDRNNNILVYNQPIFEIWLTMQEMKLGFDTLSFCRDLDIDTIEFNARIRDIKDTRKNLGYSSWRPQLFMSQLKMQDVSSVRENLFRYKGVEITKRTLRDYKYSVGAHILGSIGEVSQADIDRDPYYSRGDYAGRSGIEKTYEKQLRGEKGVEKWMRDKFGRLIGRYKDGEEDVKAVAGQDMTLTIDIQLQILAERMLKGKIGSIVAIEPKTGEILALASSPTWNPQLLIGKERSKNYVELSKDPTKPLINRALQALYPPGSTFKTIQACVCQQIGDLTPEKLYPCNGPTSVPIKCTHHHQTPLGLEIGLEQSCNPYFWQIYKDMLEKNGYGNNNEKFKAQYSLWRDNVMSFGLGQRFTDSDLPPHNAGSIPRMEHYDHCYGATGWRAITIRSLSIGQGEILVTPLQLANQAAAICNEGYYVTPHINKHDTMKTRVHYTQVEKQYFPIVKEGMWRVFEYGTGRWHKVDGLDMCGKTGTAENPHGKDHALFIGFAPKNDPKIAVAVVVENAGFGATWAAPMASLLMEQYLNGEITRTAKLEELEATVLNENVKTR